MIARLRARGGHDAWKVGGKMFACVGAETPGVSVKTDSIETAQMLIEAGVGKKAPYFHRSWVLLNPDTEKGRIAPSHHRVLSHCAFGPDQKTSKGTAAV